MALTNEQITAKNFKKFYEAILPYLNGEAHASFTPVGSIIAIMGNEAPQNFLACDGTAYNIADYLELATYFNQQFGSTNYFGGDGTTTFAVPDLRGEFLRGTGTNSHTNQGSGASVGVHQDATTIPFLYSGVATSDASKGFLSGRVPNNAKSGDSFSESGSDSLINGSGHSKYMIAGGSASALQESSQNAYAFTVKTTNTSVLYCIATKNVFSDISGSLEPGEGIVIEDNEISVDTMTAEDLQDVKDAFMPNTGAPMRMLNYSTDEQVVGKWIDGKPIYQKTVSGTISVDTDYIVKQSNIDVSNLSIDVCINTTGYIIRPSTNSFIMFPFIVFNNSNNKVYTCNAWYTNGNVIIESNRLIYNNCQCIITIQYTKTTD